MLSVGMSVVKMFALNVTCGQLVITSHVSSIAKKLVDGKKG